MNSMLQSSGIRDKVSNLSDYPILSAATHADNKPIPAHITQRVVSISFVSRQKCVFLMDYLLEIACATSKPIDSRIKSVRLMQELVLKGDCEFQPLLQKEGHKLKTLSGYMDLRAPGESSLLREVTSSLLEVLFEETERSVPAPRPYTAPTPQYSTAVPSYNKSQQYQGFGNPNFVQNRQVGRNPGIFNLVTDKVVDLLSNVPPPDPNRFARNSVGHPETADFSGSYAQNDGFVSRNSFPLRSQREAQLPETTPHVSGLPSAVWEPDTFANRADNPLAEHRTAERGEEGNLERQLVLTFTAEGGIRNKPTRQELEELVVRSRSLNCHLLASELVAQLEPRALSSKLKSLFAIEALYRNFPSQLAEAITNNSQPISSLAQTGDIPVRNKAREILLLLGIANESVQHSAEVRNEMESIPMQPEALLVETEQAGDSLFDGMLTSQNDLLASTTSPHTSRTTTNAKTTTTTTTATASLIPGLEDLEIPEVTNEKTLTSDMIDFGSSAPTVIFDPLLESKQTVIQPAPQSMNSNLFGSLTSPPIQTAHVMYAPVTYTNQATVKPESRDSFGFISEHIKTLKSSN